MHDGEQFTGVLYGFYRDCLHLEQLFNTHTLAFCFDSRWQTGRRAIYPGYKGEREAKKLEESPEARDMRESMYVQVRQFYDLLGVMGCVNRFGVKGFEGDDLIASIIQNTSTSFDEVVICSGDEDLYQCLGPNVRQYKPISKKTYTDADLMAEYGLLPGQWASVKAWAGCSSDSIPGLKGVAEKTAAKWLLGKASEKQKALFEANLDVYSRNIQLVKLPLVGCPKLVAVEQLEPINWQPLAEKIGTVHSLPRGMKVN
jgi:5'-3' exonuclease